MMLELAVVWTQTELSKVVPRPRRSERAPKASTTGRLSLLEYARRSYEGGNW